MRGFLLAIRPHANEATIVAESGEHFRWCAVPSAVDLEAGDVVTFDSPTPNAGAAALARNVHLADKWTARLTADHQPLLLELHATLHAGAFPTRPPVM